MRWTSKRTTLIYADYQPSEREAEFVERAFGGRALERAHEVVPAPIDAS